MRESTCRYEFGPFRLDPDEHLLLRDGAEVRLTPKVFDLLLALVRRHGRLVVKDELMKQVWPDRVIEEGNVTQSIVMLRKALGDSARAPRYVETRSKRGYRFIADVRESGGAQPARPARRTVGRARECAALRATFDLAVGGTGQLLCITGEPGIGKTTLVETFLAEQAAQEHAIVVSRGQCSQRLAGTAAYLPWLDALENLLQVDGGDSIAGSMRKLAPSWYAWVTSPQGETRSGGDVQASSQALMLRELRAFLMEASRRRPVVVFIDDLQWADLSTVELLAYLATRFEGMRVLFVVAYRPCEALLVRQPFLEVKRELEARGIGHELALEFLSASDIEQYLAAEFPDHRFPASFPALIHFRTEGNPLFVVDLVAYLRTRGVIVADAIGSWRLADPTANIQPEWPASILGLIQRKIDHLDGASRQLLEAASVQGYQFDSAVIGRALGMDPAAVEARLDELERVHGLVRLIGEEELADGTLTLRCRFVHVLHQNAFHASLGPSRRARLSAAIARALEDCRGDRDGAIASELAHLYEGARDFARATDAYCHAAERAGALFGHAEAAILARRGLALLEKLPETPERAQRELRLHVALGVALSITTGYAAAETGSSLARVYELCGRTEDMPQLFPAIWRLWIHRAAGAESQAARALGERLVRMARGTRDPIHLVGAHFALGNTLHLLGDLVSGSTHLERAVALHRAGSCHAVTALYSGDPGLYSWSHSARALWLLGYPERARRRSCEALGRARDVADPRSIAHALMFSAICHQLRRQPLAAQEDAEACIQLCDEYGIADEGRRVSIVLGWAIAARGRADDGVAEIRASLDALRAVRSVNTEPYYLALLAEALGQGGLPDEALAAVAEALSIAGRTGERFYEAELYRLRGELLLQRGRDDLRRGAQASFCRALELARRQRARSLELRALVSVTRAAPPTWTAPRRALARTYRWFTEGFDTLDLQEARGLLSQRDVEALDRP